MNIIKNRYPMDKITNFIIENNLIDFDSWLWKNKQVLTGLKFHQELEYTYVFKKLNQKIIKKLLDIQVKNDAEVGINYIDTLYLKVVKREQVYENYLMWYCNKYLKSQKQLCTFDNVKHKSLEELEQNKEEWEKFTTSNHLMDYESFEKYMKQLNYRNYDKNFNDNWGQWLAKMYYYANNRASIKINDIYTIKRTRYDIEITKIKNVWQILFLWREYLIDIIWTNNDLDLTKEEKRDLRIAFKEQYIPYDEKIDE